MKSNIKNISRSLQLHKNCSRSIIVTCYILHVLFYPGSFPGEMGTLNQLHDLTSGEHSRPHPTSSIDQKDHMQIQTRSVIVARANFTCSVVSDVLC